MSTRAVIARVSGEGQFKGRYSHFDGYPSGLGATLFALYRGHFGRNLKKMLKFLLDDHKAGWSILGEVNFDQPAGFLEYPHKFVAGESGPVCYCHGDRHEKAQLLTEKNASGAGAEWAYAFDPETRTMLVLSSYCGPGDFEGRKMIGAFGFGDPHATWKVVASVDLDGEEPDWEKMQE